MADLTPMQKIGLGLAAGLVGTIAMTIGQTIEMRARERPPSRVPAEGFEAASGIEVDGPAEVRLNNAVHWSYGTMLGASLALLDAVPEPSRTLAFLAGSESLGMAILQTLDLEGKPSEWDGQSAAIDVGHHLVYAVAAGLAYAGGRALLERRARH